MIGIEERDTKAGIHVFRIHYTADPMKRDEQWIHDAVEGMPGGRQGRNWRREMEIDWSIAEGIGVYSEDFNREWHVSKAALDWDRRWPIVRGWDLGATHMLPACVWIQVTPQRVTVLGELATWDGRGPLRATDMPAFTDRVIVESNARFPRADWLDYSDPSAWVSTQTDGRSCVNVMNAKGIFPRRGPVTFSERKNLVLKNLRTVKAGQPGLVIDPRCQMIIESLDGAYRFERIGSSEDYKYAAEKNAWSHIMNAWEYALAAGAMIDDREREALTETNAYY